MAFIYDLLRSGFFFGLVGLLVILSIVMVLINALNTWRTNTTQRKASEAQIAQSEAKISESEMKARTDMMNAYARVIEAQEKQKDVAYNTLLRAIMTKAGLKLEDFADIMGTVNTTVKQTEAQSNASDVLQKILDGSISDEEMKDILFKEEQ